MKIFFIFFLLLIGQATKQEKEENIFSKENFLSEKKFSLEKCMISRTITAYCACKNRTASGMKVKRGIVAANWLPLGTKIMIPKLFGNEIFVVADRMNVRYPFRLDIWMPHNKALQFGIRTAEIVVL